MRILELLSLFGIISAIAFWSLTTDVRGWFSGAEEVNFYGVAPVQPDLVTLAERAHPGYPPMKDNTALHELVYLAEYPDPEAFLALSQVLEDNAGQRRTHYMAAAWALHVLDTAESRSLLEKSLSHPRVYGKAGSLIRVAMLDLYNRPDLVTTFIDRYYLTTLTDGILVELEQQAIDDDPNTIHLEYALTNTTDQAVMLFDFHPSDAAMALWLRDASGRFYPPVRPLARTGMYYDATPTRTRLEPGDPLVHDSTLTLVNLKSGYRAVSEHVYYTLPGPGEYEIFVLLDRREMDESDHRDTERHGLHLGGDESWWCGRVVSSQKTIRLGQP